MHSTHPTSPPHAAPLRKVALLLAGLDTEAAHQLLSQMDAASARAARDAWARLGPVDAAEQAEVIAEFLGGMSGVAHKHDADSSAVELDASLARKLASDATLTTAADEAPPDQRRPELPPLEQDDPWQRIQATSARVLARCLAGENSQLVAVVLAQLSVAHAAEALQYLPVESQRELLTRIARVTAPPADLLRDIGQWLAQRLSRSGLSVDDRETPFNVRPSASASTSRRTLADNARYEDDAGDRDDAVQPAPPARDRIGSFAQLVDLDDDRLATVLREAAPLEIVLAIAGAAPDVARRWLERLPDADRRHMQRTLTQLGPWRLSDAAAAQERLVELANQPRGRHGLSRVDATGG